MTPPRNAELWRMVLDARLADVHTAIPAKVVKFDATAQTVDVQPLVKHVYTNVEGDDIVESYPQIRAVPVQYPRAGGFVLAWPLSVGDPVTILCHEWSLDTYREKGTEDRPHDTRRHSFQGAVALPVGPYKASDTISETIDALYIGEDGGAVIRIASDGTVRIGATAGSVQSVALADEVEAQLQAIVDAISGAAVVAGDGGATFKTNIVAALSGVPGSVGSSKVEVEE